MTGCIYHDATDVQLVYARADLELVEQVDLPDALALGYRRLLLETGTRQKPAAALYRAGGWRRIPPYGNFVGDPTSVCFGKTLR